MKRATNQIGLTLLEVLLVLAVGSAILVMSIQQYLSYRRDADIVQLQSNVDSIFQALTQYFRANCAKDPFNKKYSGVNLPISMTTLTTEGYLTETLPFSPIVKYTTEDDPLSGYIVQFNQYQTGGELPQRTIGIKNESTETVNIGSIVIWQAQVAVNLLHPETAPQYKELLAANCLSEAAGSIVTSCDNAAEGSTGYAVWVRPPSLSNSVANSPYWLTMPTVKQFTQMYTTDPILVLTDQTQTRYQYFVCGS